MPRPSATQKKVQNSVRREPPRVRQKKVAKKLPPPFKKRMPVKVTSNSFKGIKLGFVSHPCKFDDGIMVYLTNPAKEGVSEYVCIQPDKGETITPIVELND